MSNHTRRDVLPCRFKLLAVEIRGLSYKRRAGVLNTVFHSLSFFFFAVCSCRPIPFNNLADGSHSRGTRESHGHACHVLLAKLMAASRAGRNQWATNTSAPHRGPTPLPTQGSVLLSLGGKK